MKESSLNSRIAGSPIITERGYGCYALRGDGVRRPRLRRAGADRSTITS